MIHLANDPNASRAAAKPSAGAGHQAAAGEQLPRAKPAHPWPFLSPHANRPDRPGEGRNPSHDSGS